MSTENKDELEELSDSFLSGVFFCEVCGPATNENTEPPAETFTELVFTELSKTQYNACRAIGFGDKTHYVSVYRPEPTPSMFSATERTLVRAAAAALIRATRGTHPTSVVKT